MPCSPPLLRKTHLMTERPPFERIALILQGGGALGAYQAGVYQALAETDLHPNWVAGISIGAVNSALIAGNPPEKRVERLREFWETVCASPLGPFGIPYNPAIKIEDEFAHRLVNQLRSLSILHYGAPGFFRPRQPPPFLYPSLSPAAMSHYDVAPLNDTLKRLVDFDLINAGPTRFSVGAVNIRTGNFVYFDTTTHKIAVLCSNRHHRLTGIAISPITFMLCSRWRGSHVPAFPPVGGGAVAQHRQSDADVRPRRRERFRAPALANNRRQAGVSGLRLHDLLRLSSRSLSALAMQGVRLRFFGDFGHAVRLA